MDSPVNSLDTPYIVFKDLTLDTSTHTFLPHDKNHHATTFINHLSTELENPTPLFSEFLNRIIPDLKLQMLIQEMTGWLLSPKLSHHKSFFLKGDGRNGKGVFTKLISSLFPPHQVASLTIESLSKTHMAAELVGKRVNICGEEESRFVHSGMFKSIVAGDPIMVCQKYRDPKQITPRTKFLFSTNEIPKFPDAGIAIKERLIFIPFNTYIPPEDRIPNFHLLLLPELPGVIKWALEGLKRLNKTNTFTKAPLSQELMDEFELTVSSPLMFFNEVYKLSQSKEKTAFVQGQDLYNHYSDWCRNSNKKPFAKNNFYKAIEKTILPRTRPFNDQSKGWFLEQTNENL